MATSPSTIRLFRTWSSYELKCHSSIVGGHYLIYHQISTSEIGGDGACGLLQIDCYKLQSMETSLYEAPSFATAFSSCSHLSPINQSLAIISGTNQPSNQFKPLWNYSIGSVVGFIDHDWKIDLARTRIGQLRVRDNLPNFTPVSEVILGSVQVTRP